MAELHRLNGTDRRSGHLVAILAGLAVAACTAPRGAGGPAASDTTDTLASLEAYAVSTQRALEYLPDGESLDWVDPESGQAFRVTVSKTREDEAGRFCRDIVAVPVPERDGDRAGTTEASTQPAGVIDEGEPEGYCRDPDSGRWVPADGIGR